MASKKIHKLNGNHHLPFVLIALSFSESLLKTVWVINTKLKINLKENSTSLVSKDIPSNTFPVFADWESSETIFFSLIANKSMGNILVKELPNIDYILEISGKIKESDIQRIVKELKEIKGVAAAIEVPPSKIKRSAPFNLL